MAIELMTTAQRRAAKSHSHIANMQRAFDLAALHSACRLPVLTSREGKDGAEEKEEI